MGNLKGYNTYTISRNVESPIMFRGLPLKLSITYLSVFVVFVLLAMIMISSNVGIIIILIICVGGGGICLGGIKLFYKKYGINGFQQQRRDASLPTSFECDKSINEILRERVKHLPNGKY